MLILDLTKLPHGPDSCYKFKLRSGEIKTGWLHEIWPDTNKVLLTWRIGTYRSEMRVTIADLLDLNPEILPIIKVTSIKETNLGVCDEPYKFLHELPQDLKATIIDVKDSRVDKVKAEMQALKGEMNELKANVDNGARAAARAPDIGESSSYETLIGTEFIFTLLMLQTFDNKLAALIAAHHGVANLQIVKDILRILKCEKTRPAASWTFLVSILKLIFRTGYYPQNVSYLRPRHGERVVLSEYHGFVDLLKEIMKCEEAELRTIFSSLHEKSNRLRQLGPLPN